MTARVLRILRAVTAVLGGGVVLQSGCAITQTEAKTIAADFLVQALTYVADTLIQQAIASALGISSTAAVI